MQKVRSELLQMRAIRELGKNALMFALEDRERYAKWHIGYTGRRPEGF